jgi:hypothetical protein
MRIKIFLHNVRKGKECSYELIYKGIRVLLVGNEDETCVKVSP